MMNTGPENIRRLKTKLNNSKKTLSSRRWLERQINDPFVLAASEKNYRSRSAFKLLELNKKFRLFKKGDHVLDLGSYPGGWSQVSVNAVWGPLHGKVVAIDFKEMQPIKGVNFIRADINDEKLTLLIKKEFNNVDVVISDMAPSTTGHKKTDQIRSQVLAEDAFRCACSFLKNRGKFCCKIITGGEVSTFVNMMKEKFQYVKRYKPISSRKNSAEIFIVGVNYRQQ